MCCSSEAVGSSCENAAYAHDAVVCRVVRYGAVHEYGYRRFYVYVYICRQIIAELYAGIAHCSGL